MKNWAISLVCVVVLSLSQGRYYLNELSNEADDKAGVQLIEPEGYVNNYFHYSKVLSHAIEVVFAMFIFACAYRAEKRGFIPLLASLVLLGGTMNQFVDRAILVPYTEGTNEKLFFFLTLATSVVLALKWRHRNTTQI